VYDTEGKIIHDGDEQIPGFGKIITNEASRNAMAHKGRLITQMQGDVIATSIPIWIGDTPLGGLEVGMSLKSINNDIADLINRLDNISQNGLRQNIITVIITAIGVILFGILLSLFVANRLIIPIRKLANYAKQVGRGKYDYKISSEYNDEIGDLINAFNQMSKDLKLNEEALRKSHDELEERVEARTVELKETAEALMREIGIRELAEQALRKAHDKLEQRVKERTVELVEANEQLNREIEERKQAEAKRRQLEAQLIQTQKMDALGTLVGGIAHEFNNILGIIMGNTELALYDIPERNPAHCHLKEIETANFRAKDVVRQLLSYIRLGDYKKKPMKVTPVVKDSIKFIRSTIPKNIEIRQNIQATADTILADSTQIHQIMLNLFTNATHAMEKGGGVLEIGIQNVNLILSES